jgi:mutator protein MutT
MNKRLRIVAAVIEREGKVLIARRRQETGYVGFWEFPGGRLEKGETPEKAVEREIAEELGVHIRVARLLGAVTYQSPNLSIELLAYRASIISGELKLTDHDEIRWVIPSQLEELEFTEPDRPIVRLLAARSERLWKA